MKAKLFDTADFLLSLSFFSFSYFFISLSLSLSLSLTRSLARSLSLALLPSIALSSSFTLYRSICPMSLHLSLSFFSYPFFSLSHPSVTLVSPISLSGLHAHASFFLPTAA